MGFQMVRHFSELAVAASSAAGLSRKEVSGCHRELYAFTIGRALTETPFAVASLQTSWKRSTQVTCLPLPNAGNCGQRPVRLQRVSSRISGMIAS